MEEIQLNTQRNNPQKQKDKNLLIGIIGFAVIFIAIIAITVGLLNGSTSSNYLTYSNYSQIRNGMSYSQVVDILDGHQGVLDTSSSYEGYKLSYYTWSNSSGTKCIVVGFENGIVCAKSQYGLG